MVGCIDFMCENYAADMAESFLLWHISVTSCQILAMFRKEMVHICDTQCTEGNCDVTLIKN